MSICMQIALNMRFCFGALTWSLFDLVNLDFGARGVGGMKIRASDLKFGAPISGPRGADSAPCQKKWCAHPYFYDCTC